MTIENFSYFILGIITIITIAFNSTPEEEYIEYEDKYTQTEEDYGDFPGIEFIQVIKKPNKNCRLM